MTAIKIFNDNTEIDLEKLIETRLLFLANAGGGKSYAFRKLLEEINNQIMVIILDVEGEYKTLREKYDYLLIGGTEGDIPLNLKSAGLLPTKLFEHNVPTIIDISELKSKDRILYVKKFLEALMELPRKYWKPCLIGIEETHKLCGQQDKHDSGPAVIDLFTRGRKRGFCGVAITQRIAKLHKDVVAECNNVFAGRMWLPNDIKTAAQILGMSIKEAMELLRNLNPGELYCFGPAINRNIHKGKIALVKTIHPNIGIDLKEQISPPTNKIKSILKKLNGLPQEAERELKEKGDYLKKIHTLESELRKKPKLAPLINNKGEIKQIRQEAYAQIRELQRRLIPAEENYKVQKDKADNLLGRFKRINKKIDKLSFDVVTDVIHNNTGSVRYIKKKAIFAYHLTELMKEIPVYPQESSAKKDWPTLTPEQADVVREDNTFLNGEEKPLNKCSKIIYGFLIASPGKGFTRPQIGAMTGYSFKSGGFQTSISHLFTKGLILKESNRILVNPENIDLELGKTTEKYSIESIKKKINKCSKELLEVLIQNPESDYSREELAMATPTEYSYTSGGFQTAISKLNTLGLITKIDEGRIKLSKDVGGLL